MEITRETDYAVRCMLYLAKKQEEITMIDEISREMGIPKSFLAKILQKLSKEKLVQSFRGVKGGFRIAGKAADITLLDVVEAMQGPLFINRCVVDHKLCSRTSHCSVHPVWASIGVSLINKLKEYDFERLSSDNCVI